MKIRLLGTSFLRVTSLVIALNVQAVLGSPCQTVNDGEVHEETGLRFAAQKDLKNAESELRRAVELSPNNARYLTELGGVLGMQRKLEESSSCFEKALQLDPDNLVTRRNLASNQWQMDRLDDAEQNLEMILKAKPGDARTVLLLGMVEESMKDYAKAAQLLQSVPDLVQQQPESLAALARAYYHSGEKQKARDTVQNLLAHPAGARGMFLAAQVATEATDYPTAEKMLLSIPATGPETVSVGYLLAFVQFQQTHFEDSRHTLLDLIARGHETTEIYFLLARCYHKEGNSDEVVRVFDRAFERIPLKDSDYVNLGEALSRAKLFGVAYEVARKAVDTFPNSERVFTLKGSVELDLHSYDAALDSFSQALKLNPDSAKADVGMAQAQYAIGRTKEAEAPFEEGLKRFPADLPHYTEYAEFLLKRAGRENEAAKARAESLLRAAISIDRSQPRPHFLLGNLLLAKGQSEEGIKELTIAARLDSENAEIHHSLASAYGRLGRKEESLREMEAYQKTKIKEESAF